MPLHNQVLISLLFWAVFSSTFELESSDIRQTGLFRSTSWLGRNEGNSIEDSEMADLSTLTHLKLKTQLLEPPTLQSSMDEDVKLFKFPRLDVYKKNYRALDSNSSYSSSGCSYCEANPVFSITYTSYESSCGQTCTYLTAFTVAVVGGTGYNGSLYNQTTSTSFNITQNGCDSISSACVTTAVEAVAAVAVVLAAVIALSLSVVGILLVNEGTNPSQLESVDQIISQSQNNQGGANQIAVNNLNIPVGFPADGFNFPDDGCGDGSVRFADGTCYPVLQRGPCNEPHQWVTVDLIQLKGRCTPRLCGRQRVFVSRDGLCHDINDPLVCHGGRRLYYTAFGDPICDCPIGQYPFPGTKDDCIPLFTQGPCPQNNIVVVDPQGKLDCAPSRCQSAGGRIQQLIPVGNGFCYALGSSGPCLAPFQLLGFDVFKRRGVCVNVQDPSSPYFSTPDNDQLIDSVYNQLYAEYNDIQVFLFDEQVETNGVIRRQGVNSFGVFQLPSSLPDPLLHPCRPGNRSGINFKCTNPILPNSNLKNLLQAVSSAFQCPSTSFLQATGKCVG